MFQVHIKVVALVLTTSATLLRKMRKKIYFPIALLLGSILLEPRYMTRNIVKIQLSKLQSSGSISENKKKGVLLCYSGPRNYYYAKVADFAQVITTLIYAS